MDDSLISLTSAVPNYEGYEYQFLFFLYKVITLQKNGQVGFETLEDVHYISSAGEITLVQIKHSINNVNGNKPTFSTYDKDLWKSLTNWITLFSDQKLDIKTEMNLTEKIYLSKLTNNFYLHLFTVKKPTFNRFEKLLKKKNLKKNLKEELQKIEDGTKDKELKSRIHFISRVNKPHLLLFLKKIKIIHETQNLIERIYDSLEHMLILEDKIEQTLGYIYLQLKKFTSNKINNKEKVIIDFEIRKKLFRKYFDLGRNKYNPLKSKINSYSTMLENISDEIFIKQLLDIGYIDNTEIAEYGKKLIDFKNYLLENINNGQYVQEEIKILDDNAITIWKNSFKEIYRDYKNDILNNKISEQIIQNLALRLIDKMHKQKLSTNSMDLDLIQSNSEFYELSNRPEIGWHYNWEKRYAMAK